MTELSPLAQALIIRELRGGPDGDDAGMNGAALAALRANVLTGDHADHPAAQDEALVRRRCLRLGPGDMPAPVDLVALLLETLSQRLGGQGHATAWRSIGVKPGRGRDLLARNANALDWPIWRTLRDAALGPYSEIELRYPDPIALWQAQLMQIDMAAADLGGTEAWQAGDLVLIWRPAAGTVLLRPILLDGSDWDLFRDCDSPEEALVRYRTKVAFG